MKRAGEGSFALVSTLLIVAVMALGALAFFQAARMDRLATRNTADTLRAQLAAESGLAVAVAQMQAAMGTNDTFIITSANSTNPTNRLQLYAGHWRVQGRGAGAMNYWPLFSAQPDPEALARLQPSQPGIAEIPWTENNLTSPTVRFTNYGLAGGLTVASPALYWMAITNTNGATNARFAFWVEDLGGRLDLGVVGSTNTAVGRGQVAPTRRPTGTNPAEIALWSLFNSTSASYVANAAVADLVASRSALLTPASARLVNGAVTTNLLADFAAGIVPDTNQIELIPFGFGYADEGKPKYNLNSYLTASGVTNLARIIQANLTNFIQRAGGFPAGLYLETLAANIIDYADPDSLPTTSPSGAVGFDSYPLLTTIYDRISYTAREEGSATIQISSFLQFWNLCGTDTGDLTITVSNNIREWVTGTSSRNYLLAEPWITNVSVGSMGPNEVRVIQIGPITRQLTNFSGLPTNVLSVNGFQPPFSTDRAETNYFKILINNTVVSDSIDGVNRPTRTLRFPPSAANIDNIGGVPGLRYYNIFDHGDGINPWPLGDPRIFKYQKGDAVAANNYDERAAWWGMAVSRGIVNSSPFNSVCETRPERWPDGGHNTGTNVATTSDSQTPFTVGNKSLTQSNESPARISNLGSYTRATELGHIFDPIQWLWPEQGGTVALSASIPVTASSNSLYGGGNSLRVGRAEHPKFTNDGLRAAQLLDLFAVGPSGGGARGAVYNVTNRIPSRINLNTATTNTLRALAIGVYHTNDPALVSTNDNGTDFVPPTTAVSNFITGVINFRSQQPFVSPAQLTLISTSPNPTNWPNTAVFGNPAATGVSRWNDAAAEEWFSKIHPFTTVQSRNFLVHAVGQAMNTNTRRPLAISRKTFQVWAEPLRDTNGFVTNNRFVLRGSWSY